MSNKEFLSRIRSLFQGRVQGVGFRPKLFNLANSLNLKGTIQNTGNGVIAELEGPSDQIEKYLQLIRSTFLPPVQIQKQSHLRLPQMGFTDLKIIQSLDNNIRSVLIPPDQITCSSCLSELRDPQNRRYQYVFTTCSECGPRYSLVENLPFDRQQTTMRDFEMCLLCSNEYNSPSDRRFHSQTNSCPDCGPKIELHECGLKFEGNNSEVWSKCCENLLNGKILALKGLGGFQLICLATNSNAIEKLRIRKNRPHKAFAVMFSGIQEIRLHCKINESEKKLLESAEGPIVIVKQNDFSRTILSPLIAPDTHNLGVFLPSSGLHHTLLDLIKLPLIVTSGNSSEEPIAFENSEALARLSHIADFFIFHNRRIVRSVDDSVAQVILGKTQLLRRARGFAPLPFQVPMQIDKKHIALGAHNKNSIALQCDNNIFVSQHIGDLTNLETFETFNTTISDLRKIYNSDDVTYIHDCHPDYASTQFAKSQKNYPDNHIEVQHHYAHALSCGFEHNLIAPYFAVVWDGSGYGPDRTIWGGEFLEIKQNGFERRAWFKPFPLPGGDVASREPLRALAGIFHQMGKKNNSALAPFYKLIDANLNCPLTSSVGRIFDIIAALLGMIERQSYEGQFALRLQNLAELSQIEDHYPFEIENCTIKWSPMIEEIIRELDENFAKPDISKKFHNTLASIVLQLCRQTHATHIVLSGGCFQNRLLTELCVQKLKKQEINVYFHQAIPANDGGISLGQMAAAFRKIKNAEIKNL